tara:strand:+ start:3845 stop:4999 length:1155 start_codon:yes stop_codon:yes gene_type:complete
MIFITNFYPPEIGAASQRISFLVNRLAEDNIKIFVFSIFPLLKIDQKTKFFERQGNISILRLPIFRTTSKNIFLRLVSMLNYSLYLFLLIPLFVLQNKKYVFIQGHPLISSFFAMIIFKKLLRKKIILNISDLWPKSGLDLGVFKKGKFYDLLKLIEKFNYNNSDLIITQSEESKDYISSIINRKININIFYNVPREEYKSKNKNDLKPVKIIYAGLLGHAQNILETCKKLNFKKYNFEFHIYGDGSQRKDIEQYLNKCEDNIYLHNLVSVKELNQLLIGFDIGLVQLKNRIYGALPSKLFHYLNYSLPILFIGDGDGSVIVNRYNFGWTFLNNEYQSINNLFEKLMEDSNSLNQIEENIRNNFYKNFNYENEYQKFLSSLNSL